MGVTMSTLDLARQATVRVAYNGENITAKLGDWLEGLEYTTGLDKADDMQLHLRDDGTWRKYLQAGEGARLDVDIMLTEDGISTLLPCGRYTIDELEFGGPPESAVIRGISAYITTGLRREKKSRAWEKITLKGIAETIAKKAGLTLVYSARNNPSYNRIDQHAKSDLLFLQELCEREGCRVKTLRLSDKDHVKGYDQLLIFSQSEYDEAAGVDSFHWGDGRIIAWRFTSSATNAYSRVILKYHHAKMNKLIEYEYVPTNAPENGQTLRLNERCESQGEAERIAKNRLAAANRMHFEGALEIVGNVGMVPGLNVDVSGFGGKVDSKYAIEEARHTLWPYRTSLTLRKIE